MGSLNAHLDTLRRILARRRWLVLAVCAPVFLLLAVAASGAPERYEARARVFVDTDTVLKPLMSGLTYQPDIDQQVRMLARTLLSRTNLESLIAIPELGLVGPGGSALDHEL